MPSLIRFLFLTGLLAAGIFGGLYVLAVYFEPPQKVVSSPVPGVSIPRQ
ncbi:MAG: hypothetical protein KDJ45_14650 [Hyphomicrobiaceae bacterium]|nr:hypothetical protein [Hyphomicrobiaceae bacterium]MCC0009137.1 hypothetical protein [Hyphomicrobiaceae bacterium]